MEGREGERDRAESYPPTCASASWPSAAASAPCAAASWPASTSSAPSSREVSSCRRRPGWKTSFVCWFLGF